jgi:hypothetical protein
LKADNSFGIKFFAVAVRLSVSASRLLSLSRPEPLLALLRPQPNKALGSTSEFILLSLNRNKLAVTNFSVCFTFAVCRIFPFRAFRIFLLFRSATFYSGVFRLIFRFSLLGFYFCRGFLLWG